MKDYTDTFQSHFTVACCKSKHHYNIQDVIRLEAKSNYTVIHSLNQRPLVVAKVLAAYQDILQGMGFLRIHRTHLVNLQFVKRVDHSGNLILFDGTKMDVSRRRKKILIQHLEHYRHSMENMPANGS